MGILEKIAKPFVGILRQPIESFIRLETADDKYSIAAEDGSLVSYLKVMGSRQLIGEQEYQNIIVTTVLKMGARFDKPGHAMQVYFTRNPDRIKEEIQSYLRPNHTAAKNIGLELDDLFEERSRHLCKFIAWEEIYMVLWTRPHSMTKSDRAREAHKAREIQWVNAQDAQYPYRGIGALRNRHRAFIQAVQNTLNDLSVSSQIMEVHDALRAVRSNLFLTGVSSRWKPCLPGDPIPPRAPESKSDMSDILWPPLRTQIANVSARRVGENAIQMGQHVWSAFDMVLAPMDPSPFPLLLARLIETKIPFRVSYLIESGGVQGGAFMNFLASLLTITNDENRMIKDSMERLSEMARSEPVVKCRISFATWAPKGDLDLLDERMSTLTQAVESWGYCQVSQISGDPLDGVMSSAMGIACASTAPPAIAPMREIMKLLPWQRSSSPFDSGAVLLRTPDGRIWPYQMGSNLTTTWFDLIFAQPGAGKSVLMNSLNLGTCLTAGLSSLPYVMVVDIGPSSAGLVSLVRDALPSNRRHESVAYRLSMSMEYSINPFDTPLGARYPHIDARSYLVQLLVLLATPPGRKEPYDGIPQLCGLVVDEMYRWRDDNQANAEPRPYLPRVDYTVDEALKEHNIQLPNEPYWWDVVDTLYEKGLTYQASLAQRHALPTLGDAITASRRPQIKTLLDETKIGGSSEGVLSAFERMITSSIRELPILASITKFEISESRVCALDLADVAPQGDETANRQTAIMYMLARHVLVTPWWISEETIKAMPEKYRSYHDNRLRDIAESPKRLCFDEFHRTSGSAAVRGQIIRDVREGRKRGIQIVLASQMMEDFDDDMVDLATGVWILGTAISDRAVDEVQKRFGLSDTARWVIRHRLTGPRSTGAPALFVLGSTSGKYEQHLINTLGPIELWALSTSAEDVAIRKRLYARLGASHARRLLAANFPGGSARGEIKRRINLYAEDGLVEKATASFVIEEVVEELIDSTRIKIGEEEKTVIRSQDNDGGGGGKKPDETPKDAKDAAKDEGSAERGGEEESPEDTAEKQEDAAAPGQAPKKNPYDQEEMAPRPEETPTDPTANVSAPQGYVLPEDQVVSRPPQRPPEPPRPEETEKSGTAPDRSSGSGDNRDGPDAPDKDTDRLD